MSHVTPLGRRSSWRFRNVARGLACVSAPLLLVACAEAPKTPPPAHLVSVGERIAQQQCGECHALSTTRVSPLADAPTFASLRPRYSRAAMAAVLNQRMVTIHPRMPRLRLEEDEIAQLLDYWESIGS
jgi:mono/diheme cytochrome c family protein